MDKHRGEPRNVIHEGANPRPRGAAFSGGGGGDGIAQPAYALLYAAYIMKPLFLQICYIEPGSHIHKYSLT